MLHFASGFARRFLSGVRRILPQLADRVLHFVSRVEQDATRFLAGIAFGVALLVLYSALPIRDAPGSATSEFFICLGDNPALDFGGARNKDGQGFAAFGKLVEGMDVVRAIHDAPTVSKADDPYMKGQIIEKPVRILELSWK